MPVVARHYLLPCWELSRIALEIVARYSRCHADTALGAFPASVLSLARTSARACPFLGASGWLPRRVPVVARHYLLPS